MYLPLKRFIDILIALGALIVLLPILLPVALALRLTGEREVFYLQERLGHRNRRFKIIKFATMLKNSPNMPGGAITLRGDARVLPLGRFLRRSKINELPQLINVLKGDMSIVGPRPLMQVSFDMYTPEVQRIVYDSRPGLTGIASLIYRDEEGLVSRSGRPPLEFYREVIYPYKGQLETWYQAHKSTKTDLSIMILTGIALFSSTPAAVFGWFKDLPLPPEELGLRSGLVGEPTRG